ncbi:hypothetical protein [Sandarakinorhabdus sp.]|uniref:hypothetical protein n=1 Tax=Sandarakinorhabdus sp. TaxID=1916663 RepID=UPI00333F08F8
MVALRKIFIQKLISANLQPVEDAHDVAAWPTHPGLPTQLADDRAVLNRLAPVRDWRIAERSRFHRFIRSRAHQSRTGIFRRKTVQKTGSK